MAPLHRLLSRARERTGRRRRLSCAGRASTEFPSRLQDRERTCPKSPSGEGPRRGLPGNHPRGARHRDGGQESLRRREQTMLCFGEPSLPRRPSIRSKWVALPITASASKTSPHRPATRPRLRGPGRLNTVPCTVSVLRMMECRGSSVRSSAACELKSRAAWKLEARFLPGFLDGAGVRQGHRVAFPEKTNTRKEQA